ncbi:hypothetical protein [Burkholderia cenocepacia]|uniref:hypothetical protein n=1 Tax=Burkholderia cenocepacia TaxID=95486 RepID=UPI000760BC10|nr:hypothetical protein [Burkholderia cenocepacia]KWU23418.1 hypothetical protein AS149_37145 [Burkholderia cenocepacia]
MKVEPFLTAAEAFLRLKDLRTVAGGADPLLLEDRSPRNFRVCGLHLERAGKADVYHAVSRGGRPVIVVKAAAKGSAVLTVDEAISRLESLIVEAGVQSVPFLAQAYREGEFMLCDLWSSKVGVSDMFRAVSRGGRPIVSVVLQPPTKD